MNPDNDKVPNDCGIPLEQMPGYAQHVARYGGPSSPRPDEIRFHTAPHSEFMAAVNKANSGKHCYLRWIYPAHTAAVDGILFGLVVEAGWDVGGPSRTFGVNIPVDITAADFATILAESMPQDSAAPVVEHTIDIRKAEPLPPGTVIHGQDTDGIAPPKPSLMRRLRDWIGSGGGQ